MQYRWISSRKSWFRWYQNFDIVVDETTYVWDLKGNTAGKDEMLKYTMSQKEQGRKDQDTEEVHGIKEEQTWQKSGHVFITLGKGKIFPSFRSKLYILSVHWIPSPEDIARSSSRWTRRFVGQGSRFASSIVFYLHSLEPNICEMSTGQQLLMPQPIKWVVSGGPSWRFQTLYHIGQEVTPFPTQFCMEYTTIGSYFTAPS